MTPKRPDRASLRGAGLAGRTRPAVRAAAAARFMGSLIARCSIAGAVRARLAQSSVVRLPRVLPRDLPSDVLAMAGVALCVALGFGVLSPAIPLLARHFGVGATAASAVVSAFALLRFASGLGAGRLVNAVGERRALAIGIGVVGVSSLLAGLSQSYTQLLVLRGIGGAGSAVFGIAALSLVLRVATRRVRGRAMSVYKTGFLVGGIAGPAVGGAVLGLSFRAPFFLYAGTLVLAGAVAWVFVSKPASREPAPEPEGDEAGEPELTFRAVLRTREYQAALAGNFAEGFTVMGVRTAIVPMLIVFGLHAAPGWAGVAFLVAALSQTALMLPAGRWADNVGRRPGGLVAACGQLLLGFGGTLWTAMLGMAVTGAGAAFVGTVPGALVGDVTGRRSGIAVAVFNMSSDLGVVIGPLLAGVLVDQTSYRVAFGLPAAVLAATALIAFRVRGQSASPQRAAASGPGAAQQIAGDEERRPAPAGEEGADPSRAAVTLAAPEKREFPPGKDPEEHRQPEPDETHRGTDVTRGPRNR
jgi:MFS family permease